MSVEAAPVRRRVEAAAIAFVLLIPTLLFADVLFGGRRLFDRDLATFHYPMKAVVRAAILSGSFPYWNPMFGGGQPLAANPEYELFYPPQWLILLPGYDLGFRLSIVVHFYIAALGMYLLLRFIGLTRLSAIFGSVSFTLGGLLSSLTNLLPFLSSFAWVPLILLFVLKFLRRNRARDFALASFFLSMQVLCGEPVTLLQTVALIFAVAMAHSAESGRGAAAMARTSAWCSAIVLAAALTGAAQLLPMIDHAGDCVRALGFSYEAATGWSTPAIRLPELLFPHWMGSVTGAGSHYWGASYYQPATGPFIGSLYAGLLAFVLVVSGLIGRTRGWSLALIVMASSMILAAGSHTPVYRLLFHLPFVSATRYPEKYLLAGVFVMIVFASTVLDRILKRDEVILRKVRLVTLAVVILTAVLFFASCFPQYEVWFKKLWQIPAQAHIASFVSRSRWDWAMALLRAVALTGVLTLFARRGGRIASIALLVFVLLDLAPVAFEAAPRISSSFFTPPPVAALIPGPRGEFRLFHEAALDTSEQAQRFLRGTEGYWTLRNGLFPLTTSLWGFSTVLERDVGKTELLPSLSLRKALDTISAGGNRRALTALLMMSNVRYVLLYADFDKALREARGLVEQTLPVRAVAVPPLPRFYFADQIESAAGVNEVVNQLTGRAWSQRVVFLEKGNPGSPPSAASITRLRETAQRVDLDVSSRGASVLVIGITRHKYWKAFIDGKISKLLPANIAFQALAVPVGNHHIELRYRNPRVVTGMWISAAALLGLIALSWRRTLAASDSAEALLHKVGSDAA